ncbi:head maturation protease, ClpP-related [Lactococcus raffinolactis]|uniref:head maturation protease, ClpP-related n=1 Tax=Pseudolactococcus raffinolactis TaxID=1366 RepID=UPI0039AF4B9F
MTKTKKVPFQFKNELKNGKHVLTLSGNVRKKYWSDDDVINAKDVRETLDAVSEDIVIKLNSPGGDVFEGIEIYNYLKDHPSNVTVEVTGVAASAATFIVAGADEVIMNIGTSLMIHEASTFTWGNKSDIQKTLNALETIDESILSIYSEKTGQSNEQLEEWMNEEKWFTADEAVEFGFADSVKRDNAESVESGESIEDIINSKVAIAMAAFSDALEKPIAKNISLVERLKKGENK